VKTHSTKQAARRIGVHWVTLLRWRAAGKVAASEEIGMDGGKHWRWTEQDVENVKRYKKDHFREGQGKKVKQPTRAK
jgi:predicted site-specific integrase-resolvase